MVVKNGEYCVYSDTVGSNEVTLREYFGSDYDAYLKSKIIGKFTVCEGVELRAGMVISADITDTNELKNIRINH